MFPVCPTCPLALPVNQSTVPHTDSCVIVTALLQGQPRDPSVPLTSLAYKPCFCMLCPGRPLQLCWAWYSLSSSNPGALLTARGPDHPPSNPLATILPTLVHCFSGHCTAPCESLWSGPTHTCIGDWGSIVLLVLPTAAFPQRTHKPLGWLHWVVSVSTMCLTTIVGAGTHNKTRESKFCPHRAHMAMEERTHKQVRQQAWIVWFQMGDVLWST